jgi:hypothetical protein
VDISQDDMVLDLATAGTGLTLPPGR